MFFIIILFDESLECLYKRTLRLWKAVQCFGIEILLMKFEVERVVERVGIFVNRVV